MDDVPDALVSTSPEGQPLRSSNFRRRIWGPAVERAGLPRELRIHDMSHACAAVLIAQGRTPQGRPATPGPLIDFLAMDRYGHLFPSETGGLAVGLDRAAPNHGGPHTDPTQLRCGRPQRPIDRNPLYLQGIPSELAKGFEPMTC